VTDFETSASESHLQMCVVCACRDSGEHPRTQTSPPPDLGLASSPGSIPAVYCSGQCDTGTLQQMAVALMFMWRVTVTQCPAGQAINKHKPNLWWQTTLNTLWQEFRVHRQPARVRTCGERVWNGGGGRAVPRGVLNPPQGINHGTKCT